MCRWIAILVVACCFAPLASAQETASARALSIIEALSTRTSQPPLYALARLNRAAPDVCAELAKEILKMPSANARRMISQIGESTNASALAALMIPLGDDKNEIAADCLMELISQDLPMIVAIREATPAVDSEILARLEREGRWAEIIDRALREICTPQVNEARITAKKHREIALALFVEAFAGQESFHYLMNGVLKLIVGDKADYELVEKAIADAAKRREEAAKNGELEEIEDREVINEQDERLRLRDANLNLKRRGEAREMFRRVFLMDLARFKLGEDSFEVVAAMAGEFWDRAAEVWTPEDAPNIKVWSDHLLWVALGRDDGAKKIHAMLIMDKISGGVKIPTPEHETEAFKRERMIVLREAYPEGEIPVSALNFDDFPKEVAVFDGKLDDQRIAEFEKLDARNSQRPRVRGLRAAFKKAMLRIHE